MSSSRRPFLVLLGWLLALPLGTVAPSAHAQAAAFGFDDVARQAQALAAAPWQPPPPADAQRAALGYDAVRRIQFRARHALWAGSPFEMHFFPVAGSHTRALALFEIVDGRPRPLRLPADAFDYDGVLPESSAGTRPAIAGWRLTYPLHGSAKRDEVAAFLGASYFRALGTDQRYGLSARAIAVDTTGGSGNEEFPAFTHFWFEPPTDGARHLVFHALLDGPRVAGAYRFELHPGPSTRVEVRARLFLRAPVAMLGIAPLTSMYLHGPLQPDATDFRPEVHDSDGLQIEAANGEWLWRPLSNPRAPFVNTFAFDRTPRGFGLMQRERAFASYQDVEARYDRRPSAWVEPVGDWGPGRVELLQFHTPDETHDNVAAYWVPASLPTAGTPLDLAWRVLWQGDAMRGPPGARVVQTRSGHGYTPTPVPPQRRKLLLDFTGPGLPRADGAAQDADAKAVEAVVTLANDNAKLLRVNAYPNPALPGWRATLEFDRLDPTRPVELRVFLRNGANAISETWSYALPPD